MRRIAIVWLGVVVLAAACSAQVVRKMERRPSAAQRVPPLRGEQKLRYLVKQLDLSPADRQNVEGLLEIYIDAVEMQKAGQAQRGDLAERVRTLYTEMQEAERGGDKQRAEQLREQMKTLGPGVLAEREFFESLRAMLSEDQNAVLDAAIKRLGRAPDGGLRPIDVLRVAQGLELAGAQERKLSKVLQDFRARMKQQPGRMPREKRQEALDGLIAAVRGILSPEQATRFDKQLDKLRPAPRTP